MSEGLIKPISKRAVTRGRWRSSQIKSSRKKSSQLNSYMNLESSGQLSDEYRKAFEIDNDYENSQTDSRQEPVLCDGNSRFTTITEGIISNVSSYEISDRERLFRGKTENACRAIAETPVMKLPVLRVARVSSLPITDNTNLKEGVASDSKTRLRRAYLVVVPRMTPADRLIGTINNWWIGDDDNLSDTVRYERASSYKEALEFLIGYLKVSPAVKFRTASRLQQWSICYGQGV